MSKTKRKRREYLERDNEMPFVYCSQVGIHGIGYRELKNTPII
jgi:hypothetical protein